MEMKPGQRMDLREACVREAFAIVGESGVEGLSIREVARRLGVSHQAPYKHFRSSDHLLAEIVRRTYVMFAAHLESRPKTGRAQEDMKSLGEAYVGFAEQRPLHYRLMFGTPLPRPEEHPETMEAARHTFRILLDSIAGVQREAGGKAAPAPTYMLDALFVWATVHGLATIFQTALLEQLGIGHSMLREALPHALRSIGRAMGLEEVPKAVPRQGKRKR